MMKKTSTILVDADAFFALAHSDDANHQKARRFLVELLGQSVVFQLSNYTFAETVSALSRKLGQDAASAFIKQMSSESAELRFRWVDEVVQNLAIGIFQRQTSKNVSFFDCVNMAIMEEDGFDAIFSFDAVYTKNGFQTVEDLLKKN